MTPQDFRFTDTLRVRWAEIDAQGIVFNGHYLTYLDTAISGYWRALALPYAAAMQQLGGDLFVRRAVLDYLGPARYDERLQVGLRCREVGRSSLRFDGAIFRGEQRLVQAEMVYVFAADGASRAVPAALRGLLTGFEAGEAVVDLQLGDWATLGEAAGALRQQVFVAEQGIPADLEWDAADATATHALARNRLGQVLATGRLLALPGGAAKVGRMAVRAELRGSTLGRQVLDALLAEARRQGRREVMLHAQLSAENFYRRAGFERRGEVFIEAGLGHVEMVKAL